MGGNIANEDTQDLQHISSDLLPSASLIYSIGSQAGRWKDIFVGPGTINITDSVTNQNASITVANGIFFINGIAQAQLPNVKVQNLTFYDNTVQTTAAALYHGSFEDTSANQISAGTTSATLITMNTTTHSSGIALDTGLTNSKVTFTNAGKYLVNLTAQFRFSGGASNYNVTVWYSLNGTTADRSGRTFLLTSGQGSQTMAHLIDIVTVTAGQYVQFYWWTDVAPSSGPNGIYLYSTGVGSNPTRPSTPCISLNVFNVG